AGHQEVCKSCHGSSPASLRAPHRVSRPRPPRSGSSGERVMKILYVEDNDDNVYVVRNRLGRAGFTVLVAVDGEQGLAMAVAERPDLILMDLSLPVLDGWETTRRLKTTPETKDIPIIALSAHAMVGDRER